MVQVHAKRTYRYDVEERNRPNSESLGDVLVDGQMSELSGSEPNCTRGQVKKVKDDEDNQKDPTPAHHACGKCRFDIALDLIFNRSRSPAHPAELESGSDVEGNACEQDGSHYPE